VNEDGDSDDDEIHAADVTEQAGTKEHRQREENITEGTVIAVDDKAQQTAGKSCADFTQQQEDELNTASADTATKDTDRRTRKRNRDTYDQTRRRKKAKVSTTVYLERNDRRGQQKRRAIVMGSAALERVVAGRYEWRDDSMRATRGLRKRYWEEMQTAVSEGITNKGTAGELQDNNKTILQV